MKYDEWTARRLANIAVKKVYQHAASVPRSNATLREKELMDQRLVLGRNFCETYASRQDDTSEYPYFIGVFETVASIASRGSLLVLALITLALTAAAATLLWAFYPAISVFAGQACLARSQARSRSFTSLRTGGGRGSLPCSRRSS
jgi:hypothetical protein